MRDGPTLPGPYKSQPAPQSSRSLSYTTTTYSPSIFRFVPESQCEQPLSIGPPRLLGHQACQTRLSMLSTRYKVKEANSIGNLCPPPFFCQVVYHRPTHHTAHT